jgi:hypothetical protein
MRHDLDARHYRFERNSGLRDHHFRNHREQRNLGALAAIVLVILLVLAAVFAVPDLIAEVKHSRDVAAQRAGR